MLPLGRLSAMSWGTDQISGPRARGPGQFLARRWGRVGRLLPLQLMPNPKYKPGSGVSIQSCHRRLFLSTCREQAGAELSTWPALPGWSIWAVAKKGLWEETASQPSWWWTPILEVWERNVFMFGALKENLSPTLFTLLLFLSCSVLFCCLSLINDFLILILFLKNTSRDWNFLFLVSLVAPLSFSFLFSVLLFLFLFKNAF